ncbi:hypothetical protein FKM82_014683 [Ascaphus truei]
MSGKEEQPPKQRSCWKSQRMFWAIFPHACLVCSLVLYSIIGALIFNYIEGNRDKNIPEFEKFLVQLWNLSRDSCKGDIYAQEYFMNNSKNLIKEEIQGEWLQSPEIQWNFLGSLFFCCTVFTTVGFGHISPVTDHGKLVCMVYAAIGIPLMLLVLADLGDILAGVLSKIYKYCIMYCNRVFHKPKLNLANRFSFHKSNSGKSSLKSTLDNRVTMKEPLNITEVIRSQSSVKRKYLQMRNIDLFEHILVKENLRILPLRDSSFQRSRSCPELDLMPLAHSAMYNFDKIGEELDHLDVPIILIVLVVVIYIMCGAFILPLWETEWTFIDAFYFCFITLTTIGFGDIVPTHPNYFLLLSAYIVVGMAIMCMAFKLGQNRLVCCYKQFVCCISGGKVIKYSNETI